MIKSNNNTALLWDKYYKFNSYYHNDLEALARFIIPEDASVLEINCRGGEMLNSLLNSKKVGVEDDEYLRKLAKKKNSKLKVISTKELYIKRSKYDYVLLAGILSSVKDVQLLVKDLNRVIKKDSKIVVFNFSFIWKPLLEIAEKIGLKLPQEEPNWLSDSDVDNLFFLENYEKVKSGKRYLLPIEVPIITNLVNKFIAPLPVIKNLCLTTYSVYRPIQRRKDYSVSIVIPARNEAGHMKGVVSKIPMIAKKMEIIFVEGHSTDNTYETIEKEIKRYKGPLRLSLYKQEGKGKADAVRLGFSKATNELLMILDADLTVDPKELPKFYDAIVSGKGEMIMGSRLVYPMEEQAMRSLNIFGNKFFSWAFTFLLDQRIKDTLCGTKVLLNTDYDKIVKNRKFFGDFDPFGDYDLIFGASKLNMKIVEIPIRYKERVYGDTNISRFSHGLLLFKMVYFAAKNIKFI